MSQAIISVLADAASSNPKKSINKILQLAVAEFDEVSMAKINGKKYQWLKGKS